MSEEIRMRQEIRQQPAVFARVWEERGEIKKLAQALENKEFVFFTAFGSSFHAALYGQFLFTHLLGIPSVAAIPSFFLEQHKKLNLKKMLVIAVSQSGKVEEVIHAAALQKKRGGLTLAITNDPGSELASTCHHLLPLKAGPETSVPATKTFTATLFNLQLLTAYLGAQSLLGSLGKIPGFSQTLLTDEKEMKKLAVKLAARSRCLILSPESLKPIAQEGGLKFKECAYMMAESFEWREFFHGPVALMERETPALLLREISDPVRSSHVARRLKRLGNFTYDVATEQIRKMKDPNLAPISYAILLQLTALHLALARNINPDAPRRLRKVLRTSV